MPVELAKEVRAEAVKSIERYFEEEFEERIGNIRAAALLTFFVEELGPSIYNKAVADVQERLLARVTEVDVECHEEEFAYWRKRARKGKQ
jgi:uncharacterized protein (DUF2164 family)